MILGAQRGGTTSLFDWLALHPSVAPSTTKEVHYFDRHYAQGERWYRTHFRLRVGSRLAIEATPYLLFYPVAPARVASDLPPTTRFIVLLRDPVQRAISQYWHSCRIHAEDKPLSEALALEEQRLVGQDEIVLAGGESFAHRNFSYKARDSTRSNSDDGSRSSTGSVSSSCRARSCGARAGPARVLEWLGLSKMDTPFPSTNDARRARPEEEAVLEGLRRHFAPYNEDLFELLGTELWVPS